MEITSYCEDEMINISISISTSFITFYYCRNCPVFFNTHHRLKLNFQIAAISSGQSRKNEWIALIECKRQSNLRAFFYLLVNFNRLMMPASWCRHHSKESVIKEIRDKVQTRRKSVICLTVFQGSSNLNFDCD